MAKMSSVLKELDSQSIIFMDGGEEVLPVPTNAWKRAFILELAKHGIIAVAARDVGVRTTAVVHQRKIDADFDAYVREAIELANGVLEYNARLQALSGMAPSIMIKMLEANLPEKYSKQADPAGGIYVKAYIGFSPDEWDERTVDSQIVENQPPLETANNEPDTGNTNGDLQAVTVANPGNAG